MGESNAATAAGSITLQCQFCQSWNRVEAARIPDRPKCGKCGRPMLLDRPVMLNEESFARTIEQSDIPILVDFYADWCGPCKMMAPSIDEVAAMFQGRALVAKLDTDRAPRTAAGFNIRGIPTTIVFKGGKEFARQTGAVSKRVLQDMLTHAVG